MSNIGALISNLLSTATLISHVVLVVIIIALFKKDFKEWIVKNVGKYSIELSFFAVLVSMVFSLVLSEIVGFEPCVLCWYGRILLYPQVVLFLVAWIKKSKEVFSYAVPLTVLAGILSLYQSYTQLGGTSILPCTSEGGACSKIYIFQYGYITIPLMGLTIAIYLLLFAYLDKQYKKINL